jgi:preprotein translocase subunit SecE
MAGIQHDQTAGDSLWRDLFSLARYKPNQGRTARQVTLAVLLLTLAAGLARLWYVLPVWLAAMGSGGSGLPTILPGIFIAAGLLGAWLVYRVVNVPRFADFLIAVETEMTKVSWPSLDEVMRSSAVIIFLIFALAAILAAFDLFWYSLLRGLQALLGSA